MSAIKQLLEILAGDLAAVQAGFIYRDVNQQSSRVYWIWHGRTIVQPTAAGGHYLVRVQYIARHKGKVLYFLRISFSSSEANIFLVQPADLSFSTSVSASVSRRVASSAF